MPMRRIEVFSAGCPCCDEAVQTVLGLACSDCSATLLDMSTPDAQRKAKAYGIAQVPAVVVNGRIADCCSSRPVDVATLKQLGVGEAA